MDKMNELLKSGKTHSVKLSQPINVHILYLTAWAVGEEVHFRKDIYDRDKPLISALKSTLTL